VADTQTDVLVAVYQELDAATMDFDSLMRIVDEKQAEIEGAILVTHDAQGEVTVVQHGDHLGRKGLGWGSGAGLVVGLFAPPLLGSIVVGAAAGGVIGRFTDHKVKAGMEELGERLPPGTAGIITVFDDEHRLAIEQALPGSPAKSIAQTDRQGVRALKAELGTAMGKFVQGWDGAADPGSRVRWHGGQNAEGLGRRLGDDPWAEGARRRPQRPARPDRRRRLRSAGHVRWADQHAQLHPGTADGRLIQRLPRDGGLLTDPRGPADRAQPAPRGLRVDRRVPGTVPRVHGRQAP
jgi:uncharacterized membrane protein